MPTGPTPKRPAVTPRRLAPLLLLAAAVGCGGVTHDQIDARLAIALNYPIQRMTGSYLFVNGETYDYVDVGVDPMRDGTIRLHDGQVVRVDQYLTQRLAQVGGVLPPGLGQRTPVLAYGSNAAPLALQRKFSPVSFARKWAVIPVLKGSIKDFEVVHAAHFGGGNGLVPATIQYAEGAQQEVWVTLLDPDELRRMHVTEGFDPDSERGWYHLEKLEPVQLRFEKWATPMTSVLAYIDNFGALAVDGRTYSLSAVGGTPKSPPASQEQIVNLVSAKVADVAERDEVRSACSGYTGTQHFLCGNIVDMCLRDDRTERLRARRLFVDFQPPPGVTYQAQGSKQVGYSKTLPQELRCNR